MRSKVLKMPNAAVGQSGMQALYETMFRNYGILVGQVLVTQPDFANMETKMQLFQTIHELLNLNIIPIINTNDAVSPPPQSITDYGGKKIRLYCFINFQNQLFFAQGSLTEYC